jgi:hypothetical protein
VRKVVARNHQVLGVNQAVAAVVRQEELKRSFPGERLKYRVIELPLPRVRCMPNLTGQMLTCPRWWLKRRAVWRRRACRAAEPLDLAVHRAPTPTWAGWAWSGTPRAAASRTRWPSSPRRCGAPCRATSPLC